jgi:hypothetical protein
MATASDTKLNARLDILRAQGFNITDGFLVVYTAASCDPNGDPKAGAGVGFDWGSGPGPRALPTEEPFPAEDALPRDNVRAELFVRPPPNRADGRPRSARSSSIPPRTSAS